MVLPVKRRAAIRGSSIPSRLQVGEVTVGQEPALVVEPAAGSRSRRLIQAAHESVQYVGSAASRICPSTNLLSSRAVLSVHCDGVMGAEPGATPEQAPQPDRTETAVPKRKKVPHLAPVENIPAQGLDRPRLLERPHALDRRARALRDRAADRLRADARGRQVGPPRQLAVGGRHRRGALLPRAAPRPRAAAVAGPRPLRALARATPRRSSTRRWPATATSRTRT